jgi:hypothetical protein
MINAFPLVLEAVGVIGGATIVARTLRPHKTIPALMAQVDTELMRRMYLFHEDRLRSTIDGAVIWKAIGGIRGLPHFLSQGRLLVKIMLEIKKQHPGEYEFEFERIRGARGGLLLAAIVCIWDSVRAQFHPRMYRISTFVASSIFVHMAALCESVMEDAGYAFPGILPHGS